MSVDRTPKPCLHPQARHEHGTRNAYIRDRCKCFPCALANGNYENERVRAHAYGRWNNLVDAGPAREHVRALMAAGMGAKRVARTADVTPAVVGRLLYGIPSQGAGPSKRLQADTARRLLAVTLDLAPNAHVDSTGTTRRLQALVAMGWPLARLAARLGILASNFTPIAHGRRQATVATAEAVRALYDELWNVAPDTSTPSALGGVTRARRYAARHRWAPALAWDDDTIDDPAAQPAVAPTDTTTWRSVDESRVLRRMGGDVGIDLTRAERHEVVRRLHAAGMNDREIERRAGIDDRQVLRDRQALGLRANVGGMQAAS